MQIFIVSILLSVAVAFLGMNRKFGFWGYLFASLLFTPLIGLLFVLASDRKKVSPVSTSGN